MIVDQKYKSGDRVVYYQPMGKKIKAVFVKYTESKARIAIPDLSKPDGLRKINVDPDNLEFER